MEVECGNINYERALVLISCTKTKQAGRFAAKDLYCSMQFKWKRGIVERERAEWVILSDSHGLLEPNQEIDKYCCPKTLRQMGVADRKKWADRVRPALIDRVKPFDRPKPFDRVIVFAGKFYVENLNADLASAGIEICAPLKGLGQGKQSQWLKQEFEKAS